MNGYAKTNGSHKSNSKDRFKPARRRGGLGNGGKWVDIILYGVFSVLMACVLKYAVSGQYWNLNFFLLALQSGCAVGVVWILRRNGYFRELKRLDIETIKAWLPLSILLLVSNYISYKALECLSLPTYNLLSTTTIFTVPYTSNILFGTPIPSFAFLSYIPIFSGICLSAINENALAEKTYGDRRLEQTLEPHDPVMILFFGYIFMILHLILYSVYEAWKVHVVRKKGFGDWDVFLHNHLIIFVLSTLLSYLIEDFSSENMNDCFPSKVRTSIILAIVYTCIGIFPILFYSERIVRNTSNTTFSIADTGCKMGTALCGFWVFGLNDDWLSVGSVMMGCLGGVWGRWLQAREKDRERKGRGAAILPI